jgi:hypothetical protein
LFVKRERESLRSSLRKSWRIKSETERKIEKLKKIGKRKEIKKHIKKKKKGTETERAEKGKFTISIKPKTSRPNRENS